MIHFFPPPARTADRQGAQDLATARRAASYKAAAAVAVAEGHLSAREACELCRMDPHELEVWQHVVRDHGLRRMFAGNP